MLLYPNNSVEFRKTHLSSFDHLIGNNNYAQMLAGTLILIYICIWTLHVEKAHDCEVINKIDLKFGCLQFLLKRNNTNLIKVRKKISIAFQ